MNYLKALFFITLLSFSLNSHADSDTSVSVMDIIDRGENSWRSMLCGKNDQTMDTRLGKIFQFILCGKSNKPTASNNQQAENSQQSSLSSPSTTRQIPNFPDFEFVTIEAGSFKMGSPKKNSIDILTKTK